MSCISWNVQGLGNLDTVNALRTLVRKVSLGLVFLSETRIDSAWANVRLGLIMDLWWIILVGGVG